MRLSRAQVLCTQVALLALPLCAQDLAPRAYVITPVGFNATSPTWSYYKGGVNFNGVVPITGATGTFTVPVFSYYHSFSFFGRAAKLTAFLPYGVGPFKEKYSNTGVRFIARA